MQLTQLRIPGSNQEGTPTIIELPGPANFSFTSVGDVLTKLIPVMLTIAGLILFIYLMWGGFDYLTSAGDPAKMDSAKQKVTHALMGFILVFISYFLTQLICFVFGCTAF